MLLPGLAQVDVQVHQPRQHPQAGGRDHLLVPAPRRLPYPGDPPLHNEQCTLGVEAGGGVEEPSAGNE